MRLSPDLLTSTCSWPYKSAKLLTSFSWKGDMAQKDSPVLFSDEQRTTSKSRNVSADSGIDWEKDKHRDASSSDEVSPDSQTKVDRRDRLEAQQFSCPSSPQSPFKHLDDSDFNESPLEKRTAGSFSVDNDSVFQVQAFTENATTDEINNHSSFSDYGIVPSSQERQELTLDDLSHSPHYPVHSKLKQNENEKLISPCPTETDEMYSNGAVSAYYVQSSASPATDDTYCQSSTQPPPRSSFRGLLRRGETCSEADASERMQKCQGKYKSLRSQSDPSTHYTTVVKPIAVKPDPVNLTARDLRSSIESLHPGQELSTLVQFQNRRSAFREHLRGSLSQCEGVDVLYSWSSGTPPLSASSERNYAETNKGTPHSSPIQITPTRACSLNDITSDSHFQCVVKLASSSASLQPDLGLAHSSNLNRSCGCINNINCTKHRHSTPLDVRGPTKKTSSCKQEPIHMTLDEVRNSLQTLNTSPDDTPTDEKKSPCRQFIRAYLRSRKSKRDGSESSRRKQSSAERTTHRHSFPSSVKAAFSSWFGFRRTCDTSQEPSKELKKPAEEGQQAKLGSSNTSPFMNRALPPLPIDESILWGPTITVDEESTSLSASDSFSEGDSNHNRVRKMDYAASIEKVKDCGWYWGPISGETAEKLLVSEPDGSFVLRDSSDEHYIFSLTFKLNGLVRHVRIEHDHGNFSFGCLQKFRSNTIVDFIENAVEHSRSGRYLFFLHRRPILGPMRVQLLHPVSRFKQVQSLQHLCRFVILKAVRRDLIDKLPLPRRMKDYLNTPHYYSEELPHLPLPTTGLSQQQQQPENSSLQSSISNTVNPQPES